MAGRFGWYGDMHCRIDWTQAPLPQSTGKDSGQVVALACGQTAEDEMQVCENEQYCIDEDGHDCSARHADGADAHVPSAHRKPCWLSHVTVAGQDEVRLADDRLVQPITAGY